VERRQRAHGYSSKPDEFTPAHNRRRSGSLYGRCGAREEFAAACPELMNQVVANELTDRAPQRKWMYLIDKREGKQTLTAELVDTSDGPLYRLLDKHVEHTVKIVGVVSNATAHGMKDTKEEMKEHGMDKNSTEHSHMTVTDLIMVSATCQKQHSALGDMRFPGGHQQHLGLRP
jgi:hypothetical protein